MTGVLDTGPHAVRVGDRVSVRVHRRACVVAAGLVLAILIAAIVSLLFGQLGFGDVFRTLAGHGDRSDEFLLYTLAVPRLLCALLVGAALGASGSVFQNLTRNPLGSPDLIGFTTGSSVGAVFVLTVLGGGMAAIAGGALVGGLVTGTIVYALTIHRKARGYQLVLVGIGANAMLQVVTHYLLTRANLESAMAAQIWLTGNLNGRGWEHFWPALIVVAIFLPLLIAYGRRLSVLEIGDEAATALGVNAATTRLGGLALGVVLVATATATAGPVSFVALAAPQLARRLTRAPGAGTGTAALMGALILVLGDLLAREAFPVELPTGITTGAVGGVYLGWLLCTQWRSGKL
ncbi:iron chelate uptake ABC transporter family permease subunit [Amycolatopsis acidicola]|uniref:Iron chelate uptake ABC transporter family permease subunit n=1 Tax=Amycolatopsis acidicola TaxID=2596893 RepID=A0A5N0UZT3_9PSEU|nr:iron chelate uptake ABC transporter family permease subunit [Amycolatopsis acidicola]KAA9158730.1 iron chelate uptake ABC transporter family permease subunit [Amycolatopsis acidicola]